MTHATILYDEGGRIDPITLNRADDGNMFTPLMCLETGDLIKRVVPDDQLAEQTRALAPGVAERGAFALAAVKSAFGARHGVAVGLAHVAHDLLLRQYLEADESRELGLACGERRKPDASRFAQ